MGTPIRLTLVVIARGAAAFVALIGCVVLLGWFLDLGCLPVFGPPETGVLQNECKYEYIELSFCG
ncbi:MAG: hypothetical protein ACP5XB_28170, partial [Isosphaeraceae bacterium]